MMYHCIMNSLSKEGKKNINVWKNQLMVNKLVYGNLLLNVLVRESHLDTNTTTAWIRTQLLGLDEYMLTVGSDIGTFNFNVQTLVGSLKVQVETSNDLLTNLFKGRAACSDKTFVACML